jgi:hypothetical protein
MTMPTNLCMVAIGAKDIVEGDQAAPPAAKPLDDVLTKASPARK